MNKSTFTLKAEIRSNTRDTTQKRDQARNGIMQGFDVTSPYPEVMLLTPSDLKKKDTFYESKK